LDRGELTAGIFQLALLRQLLRIERATPRLERPTTHADANRPGAVTRPAHAGTSPPMPSPDRASPAPAPAAGCARPRSDRTAHTAQLVTPALCRQSPMPSGTGGPVSRRPRRSRHADTCR